MEPRQKQFSVWYFVAAFVILVVVQRFLFAPHTENLSYSDFKALIRAGKVADVTLGPQAIAGRLSPNGLEGLLPKEKLEALKRSGQGEHRFVTVRVDDPTLIPELEAAKVRFAGQVENVWLSTLLSWILPAVIFFALWGVFMKRMGAGSGVLAIGKSKAKVYMEKETGVAFADVAGINEAKSELMEIVEFLKTPERYRRLGGKIPKGVLIVGARGPARRLATPTVPRTPSSVARSTTSFSRSSLASVSSWTRRARSVSVTRPCASANSLPISSSIV